MELFKKFGAALLVGMCLLIGFSTGLAQLTPASNDAVIAVANNWLHLGQETGWGWTTASDFSPESIQEIEYQGQLLAFNLPVADGGHIIIPAYRELPPITAYSTQFDLDINEEGGFAQMLREVLSYKVQLLQEFLTDPNPSPEMAVLQDVIDQNAALWQSYTSDYMTFTKAVNDENERLRMDSEDQREPGPYGILSVGPLVSSTWHQGYPYNDFCPYGDGGRCVVGCVATAMTMIMHYWKYPDNGIGSRNYYWNGDQSCGGSTSGQWLSATFSDSYDWDNILDSYGGNQTQRDAVAELCYEGGVSVAMDYGYCASGVPAQSYHSRVITALKDYFGYSDQIDAENRSSYSASGWFTLLQDELNLSRPMQYGLSGHSIVCDGWRVSGSNQIHLNYGWGGPYTGWYIIDNVYLGGYWYESAIRRIIGEAFMNLTSPNGGQIWCTGTEQNINWSGAGFTGDVTISIDRDYPSGSWDVLFSSTDHDGIESWTVTGPATTNARIRIISDSEPTVGDTMDGNFTIAEPYISVSTPNGGEAWYVSQSQTIHWSSCGVTGNVDVTINRDYPSGDWDPLFTNTDDDGYEEWTVSEPTTNNARIRVVSVNTPSVRDSSAGDFTIGSRYVALTEPVGGETWYVGEDDTIQWISENVSGTVSISLSRNALNGPWENIVENTTNDGEHPWEVTIPTTTNTRVRIIADSYSDVGDTSAGNFTITDVGDITVTLPNGSEVWIVGNPEDITWTSGGVSGNVKIELDREYPSTWETLYSSTTNDGIQSWLVAGAVTDQARIQISSVSAPTVLDVSDADFTIEEDDPPMIVHDPKDDGEPGSVLFVAGVLDELPGVTVRLFHRLEGAGSYDSTDMSSTGNPDEYAASVNLWDDGSYEYYVKAYDVGSQASTTSVYDFQLYPSCGIALYYDDGSGDRANWAGDTRFRWAVRFTPVTTPYILCGSWFSVARVLPDSGHSRVRVEVYDSDGPSGMPGTVLFDETTGSIGNAVGGLTPGQTHWASVHIRNGIGDLLVLYDDFYIAVSNPDSGGYEAFARDTTSTIADRSYLYDGCLEQWYAENDVWENCKDGNRIIRAVGYYQEPPEIVVLRSGDDAQICWVTSGAPYYRVYSDVTPFGGYGTFEGSTSDTTLTDVNAVTGSTMKFYRVMSSSQP